LKPETVCVTPSNAAVGPANIGVSPDGRFIDAGAQSGADENGAGGVRLEIHRLAGNHEYGDLPRFSGSNGADSIRLALMLRPGPRFAFDGMENQASSDIL
jgi:hypothetical protein